MPGPCSLPFGDKAEWERHNQTMCLTHSYFNDGFILNRCPEDEKGCVKGTLRVWLAERRRLHTGKTR